MVSRLKRIGLQVLGWLFIVLGIAGLILPVLQGILFLMIGLYLLSREYEWAQRWMDKLYQRYPGIFSRAQYWMVRLGLTRRSSSADARHPQPMPLALRVLTFAALLSILVGITIASRMGFYHLRGYWSEMQKRYEVVAVSGQGEGYLIELRRKWALRDRRYVVRCHICAPVEVGSSYHFEQVPGRRPPMMKRAAGPGEIPDFYTVIEGRVRQ